MRSGEACIHLPKAVLASLMAVTLSASCVPLAAYADDGDTVDIPVEESVVLGDGSYEAALSIMSADAAQVLTAQADGTVDCGRGWVLEYAAVDEGVSITGVSSIGTGSLAIPQTVDGKTVVAIGNNAFEGCTGLDAVTLPDTVTDLGLYAFFNSSVKSINIPASVWRIPYRCFAMCSSLESVDFQGDTIHYLAQMAFAYCSSLKKIELPLLTTYPTREEAEADGLTGTGAVDFFACIGAACFQNCSSLSEVVLGGPIVRNAKTYFLNTSCLAGCASSLSVVCKGSTVSIPSGTGGSAVVSATDLYYTLDFYGSSEDAVNVDNRLGSVTYKAVERSRNNNGNLVTKYLLKAVAAAYGTEDYSSLLYEGSEDSSVPACPSGKSWGIVDATASNPTSETGSVVSEYSFMNGSYQVVAVDPQNVAYGWVTCPSIDDFYSKSLDTTTSGMGTNTYPTIYSDDDGNVSEIMEIAAYATNGAKIDESNYKLVFEVAKTTISANGNTRTTTWTEIAREDIKEAGQYRVHAEGLGAYEGATTETLTFEVVTPGPAGKTYYDADSRSYYLGSSAYDASVLLPEAPAYNVVVPASDWRNQLLGAGFAGAGGGLLLTDCVDDYSNNMMQAAMQSGSDSYLIIGSEDAVPQSSSPSAERYLSDFVAERTGTYGTRYGAGADSAQGLSHAAISKFKAANWNAAWGSTAIVASPSKELLTEAAAQYAYAHAARVFFLTDEGTLADEDMTLLASSDIADVVVVGGEDCVPASVANDIAARKGTAPTRILNSSTTAAIASVDLAKQLVAAGSSSYETVIIADAADSANVSNAAVRAQLGDGVMLTCRSSADAKMIQSFLEGVVKSDGRAAVKTLCTVGAFEYLSEDATEFFNEPWNVDYDELRTDGSFSVATGDTFEVDGYVYQVTGASSAKLVALSGSATYPNVPSNVTFKGTAYSVTAGAPAPSADAKPMYRLYNPYSGEHFYTAGADERDNVIAAGWNDEGIGWTAPASSTKPVYRLYNQWGGEHHYTMSASERDSLVSVGWTYEGIGWYSDTGEVAPLYRQYNPYEIANNHNYTKDAAERDYLVSLGWNDEGTGWYGVA